VVPKVVERPKVESPLLRTAGTSESTYFYGVLCRPDQAIPRRTHQICCISHRTDEVTLCHPSLRATTDSSNSGLSGPNSTGGNVVKRRILVALALVGLLSVVLISRAGAATKTTSPVTTFAGAVVGTSTLARTDSSISFSLQTSGLQAGHAVTVWWMVFNPNGSVSVQYAAGHVIDEGGAAQFGGFLQEGDLDGVINGGPGLLDATSANVVLVVRGQA
jgi:hypothetical protein